MELNEMEKRLIFQTEGYGNQMSLMSCACASPIYRTR